MESELAKKISALSAMKEDEFSEKIIKPLFEAMGYCRVDFNGGPGERGRDLIAQMTIPPFEEPRVTYIQSKKIGNIQNATESQKFTALLHQLRSCIVQPLLLPNGKEIKAQVIFLACPEQASNRFIEEVGHQLSGLNPSVNLLDGPKIIEKIKIYKPELLNSLVSVDDILTSKNGRELQDINLFKALRSDPSVPLTNYYSDLSFFVGSIDSNALFSINVTFKKGVLTVKEESTWKKIKTEVATIRDKFKFELLVSSEKEIEDIYKEKNDNYKSKENKENISIYNSLRKDIYIEIDSIKNTLSLLSNFLDKKVNTEEIDQYCSIREIIQKLSNKRIENIDPSDFEIRNSDIPKNIIKEIENIQDSLIRKHHLFNSLQEVKEQIYPEAHIELSLNQNIEGKIAELKNRYRQGIIDLQKQTVSRSKIERFLNETEESLAFIEKITSKHSILHDWCNVSYEEKIKDRVSLSPHDIFSTGKNIAVYGGAGVGKTTTLQAYASLILNSDERLNFYIPLNKLSEKFSDIVIEDGHRDFLKKDLIVKSILMIKGISPTEEHILSALPILSNNLTIILDGLDEIYNIVPEIINAIHEFKDRFKLSQIIISSRDCVSYLSEIEFLGITLLPFTKEQLTRFIVGWMNDDSLASALLTEIEEKSLYEHLKTPLLATITCALTKNGVKTPTSEYSVYDERLLLLTGEYDKHKRVERQNFKGPTLLKIARKIAYSFQKENLRSATKAKLLSITSSYFSSSYSSENLEKIINELIDPCNILQKDPITDEFSFGHFRFQEHLAAEELRQNRAIDLTELALKDWWRGTLTLYAQESEFIHLLEDLYHRHSNIKGALKTILSMVNAAPKDKRSHLMQLVAEYEKSDYLDDILDFCDDPSSYDYI